MKLLLSHRYLLVSSRIMSGRNWVRKRIPRHIVRKKPKRFLNRRQSNKRVVGSRKIKERIERLKSEIAEISMEQKSIAEGQKQMRKKYEQIQREREKLWKEIELISQQSHGIRVRLNLMFEIMRARVENDYAKVTQLTLRLRDLIAKPKEEKEVLMDQDGNNNIRPMAM
ncbi:golgin subfamily A member 6-like protein 2 [Tripterygium wilfordii]|uniref:golgin subfamily A member 6-like protein 2 n=1 Tax=Tripterygium wilfordii TaxID=458696 RepID=UPI0018F7FA4D|nr:golgin subfamily A member 6-like protein 2 [Tripterygium wilfordii]